MELCATAAGRWGGAGRWAGLQEASEDRGPVTPPPRAPWLGLDPTTLVP